MIKCFKNTSLLELEKDVNAFTASKNLTKDLFTTSFETYFDTKTDKQIYIIILKY